MVNTLLPLKWNEHGSVRSKKDLAPAYDFMPSSTLCENDATRFFTKLKQAATEALIPAKLDRDEKLEAKNLIYE